jgi:hypothetical protein
MNSLDLSIPHEVVCCPLNLVVRVMSILSSLMRRLVTASHIAVVISFTFI